MDWQLGRFVVFWTSGFTCEPILTGSTERRRKYSAEKRAESSALKSRVTTCLFVPSPFGATLGPRYVSHHDGNRAPLEPPA